MEVYTHVHCRQKRYDTMVYNRCGKSGLKLPVVSLGLWHNFGDTSIYENMKQIRYLSIKRISAAASAVPPKLISIVSKARVSKLVEYALLLKLLFYKAERKFISKSRLPTHKLLYRVLRGYKLFEGLHIWL